MRPSSGSSRKTARRGCPSSRCPRPRRFGSSTTRTGWPSSPIPVNRTDDVIPPVVEAGIDGLECFHSKHTPSEAAQYLELAGRYRLLVTGGSDCHGANKGRPLIGTVKLPYAYVELLKAKAAERRPQAAPCVLRTPISTPF